MNSAKDDSQKGSGALSTAPQFSEYFRFHRSRSLSEFDSAICPDSNPGHLFGDPRPLPA
jgi:hypothetical protein